MFLSSFTLRGVGYVLVSSLEYGFQALVQILVSVVWSELTVRYYFPP